MTPEVGKLEALLARIQRNRMVREAGMPNVLASPAAPIPTQQSGTTVGTSPGVAFADVSGSASVAPSAPAAAPPDELWDDMRLDDDAAAATSAPPEAKDDAPLDPAARRVSRTPLELAVEVELERVQAVTGPGEPQSGEVTRLDIDAAMRAGETAMPAVETPLNAPDSSGETPSFDDITIPRTDLGMRTSEVPELPPSHSVRAAPSAPPMPDELSSQPAARSHDASPEQPQRIAPTSVAPPSQPIVRTVGGMLEIPQLTFGDCLRRSLALRPR
jgi:hypothetical protein